MDSLGFVGCRRYACDGYVTDVKIPNYEARRGSYFTYNFLADTLSISTSREPFVLAEDLYDGISCAESCSEH